jgi:glycogen operon protein
MPDDAEDLQPGTWRTLGAVADSGGTNFAVWAPGADRVEVSLLGLDGPGSDLRATLPSVHHGVHHGYLPGLRPGTSYGFRAYGPWAPAHGKRYNPAKLLLDPYARAIDGRLDPTGPVFGHTGADDLIRDERDSAPYVPHAVVVDQAQLDGYDWRGDAPPRTAWSDTVIYEAHVRGLTARHPDVPATLRGTYAGLAHPAVIDHLLALGVTAIELLPIHQFVSEPAVVARGLVNYWGYNSIGFFAPHNAYASSGSRGEQIREFRDMVSALHSAGLEVILDVVYNHSGEGDELGPTLSFRGLDNTAYYWLREGGRRYRDFTGTGNTLHVEHPNVLRMIMDSLRYWVQEMHVDGFRFDLAPALTRSQRGLALRGHFLPTVAQDPVLAGVKLIAEPWDVGDGGYRLGEFPTRWTEWNDRYRDTVRDFWRGRSCGVRDLAYRLSGSSDLYRDDDRMPNASVNFVTSHDGFTLRDLVSYDRKHNDANGEHNRDGMDDNRSWNCGVEGETDDAAVLDLRRQLARSLAATLLLSTGVPMWLAGDELGRSQRGHNNAYCQDNEISWLDWSVDPDGGRLLDFVRRVTALRRDHPALRQRYFFDGRPVVPGGPKDIAWLAPSGAEMTDDDWFDSERRTLGMLLSGGTLRQVDRLGRNLVDDTFLIWLHADESTVAVTLPPPPGASPDATWSTALDTADVGGPAVPRVLTGGSVIKLAARSVLVLQAPA